MSSSAFLAGGRVEELNVLGLPCQLCPAYPGEPLLASSGLTAENSFFLMWCHSPATSGSALLDAGSEQGLRGSLFDDLSLLEHRTRAAAPKLRPSLLLCILPSCVEMVTCV